MRKYFNELLTSLEDPKGEILCGQHVDRGTISLAYILPQEANPSLLGLLEFGEVVISSPLQRFLAEINAEGSPLAMRCDPLAADGEGAAKVLAK